jgi:hypothetical protein
MADIRVESVRNVFNDGTHNAFTDLVWFRDRLFLTFRSCPDGHMVFTTSRIVVMVSDDVGETWREVHRFSVPERDVRDPHFLVFRDTLFVYTGAWLVEEPRDINNHLGYCVWSVDGEKWQGPRFLEGTYGHYIWRAATRTAENGDEHAYLCARRRHGFARAPDTGDGVGNTESAMLESDDGIVWRLAGFFQLHYGDETAFVFEDDGAVLAVCRSGGNHPAQVCRSAPPYREWTRSALHRNIGGPMLARWGDRYLVGGRKTADGRGSVTAIGWLDLSGTEPQLIEGPELPSGGDNSYPGFVQLSDTEGLLSYYISHEGSGTHDAPSSIYLARLQTA